MNKKTLYILLLIFIYNSHILANDLKTIKEKLGTNKLLVEKKRLEGPWPRLTIYTTIASSPLEAMAVYAAYPDQIHFVPGIIKATVTEQKNGSEVTVDYEFDLPWPLSTSEYSHWHKVSKYQDGYKLEWNMTKSDASKKTQGYVIFLPKDKNSSYVLYQNFFYPTSFFAGALRPTFISDTQETLQAIFDYTIKLKKDKPELLSKYKKWIEDSINGKNVFLKK